MDLSVIIVNYNVRYFLEQCLHSVLKAAVNIRCEIIVVDNNSVDGSCQMVTAKFPDVKLIANNENVGFSRANNQGIKISAGEFILILNPDTIVQEDTFVKCLQFMRVNPDAGSLGVKMIDGKGTFLPESKRSLPTPAVSFYKIFGISSLFPKSRIFGRYHLGYLNVDETNKVEILPGAFMFIRKSVLNKIGLLDETFFMYGEDIDLSYRIMQAGYDNYYFPETTIIHYKGESTKKGSINYVLVFYRAMIIFARKHFSKKNARLFSFLINMAIYLRASASIIRRLFLNSVIPLADVALMYTGFYIIKPFWEKIRFGRAGYYPEEYMYYVVPAYILIWLFSLYMSGAYEKKTQPKDIFRGILLGTTVVLIIYALLPETLRFSRALLLFGAVWGVASLFLTRITLGTLFNNVRLIFKKKKKRIVIAGSNDESKRVLSLLQQANISPTFVGLTGVREDHVKGEYLGNLSQINDIVKINRIDEIVFCAKDIPSQIIIETMLSISDTSVDFKIAPPESISVIGSSSINTAGELYIVSLNSLSQTISRRKKRIFDVLTSIVLLALSPFLVFYVNKPLHLLKNILYVLTGAKTWIGYYRLNDLIDENLPKINHGVLTPVPASKERILNKQTIDRLNLLYAKDYKMSNDLSFIIRDLKFLGN
ncbi:MAG: glycosyltransferase [Bacteroidales bacterium]|nr:glycosyltransferase [Bacteroidales bacterium]